MTLNILVLRHCGGLLTWGVISDKWVEGGKCVEKRCAEAKSWRSWFTPLVPRPVSNITPLLKS